MIKIVFNNLSEDIWANVRLATITNLVQNLKRGKALDLGCGPGYVLQVLLDLGFDAVGSDIHTHGAPKNLEHKIIRAKAEKLPFKNGTFDLVICGDVLEHIKNDTAAIREICRVLKKGGIALIMVPAFPLLYGPHDLSLGHYRRYSKKDLSNKFSAENFKVSMLFFTNSLPFLPYFLTQKVFKFDVSRKKIPTKPYLPLVKLLTGIESSLRLPFGLTLVLVTEKR
jgi:SAM-dependent methyltransferase